MGLPGGLSNARAAAGAAWKRVGKATKALGAAGYFASLLVLGSTVFLPNACDRVERFLQASIVGQDLAIPQLVDAVCSHVDHLQPRKPLVLSVHGPPGVGKTFTTTLLAALYNRDPGKAKDCPGDDCKGMKVVYGLDFESHKRGRELDAVRQAIREHLASVRDAVVVIAEYDKLDCASRAMVRQLLDHPYQAATIAPSNQGSQDNGLKRAIVVLESNLGANELDQLLLKAQGNSHKLTPDAADRVLRDAMFSGWQRNRQREADHFSRGTGTGVDSSEAVKPRGSSERSERGAGGGGAKDEGAAKDDEGGGSRVGRNGMGGGSGVSDSGGCEGGGEGLESCVAVPPSRATLEGGGDEMGIQNSGEDSGRKEEEDGWDGSVGQEGRPQKGAVREACEETHMDLLRLLSHIDYFLPFLPLQRPQVEELVSRELHRWRGVLWEDKYVYLLWRPQVIAYLTDKVEFDGPYPTEGGKPVQSTCVKAGLARIVRSCPGFFRALQSDVPQPARAPGLWLPENVTQTHKFELRLSLQKRLGSRVLSYDQYPLGGLDSEEAKQGWELAVEYPVINGEL